MNLSFKILPVTLLSEYKSSFDNRLIQKFGDLQDSELSIDTFSFYTSVSAVFSSKIEGEDIELDSYIKHKRLGVHYQPDYTQKIDDLYNAYLFTQKNKLSQKTLLKSHATLTSHILHISQQGKLRKGNMFVITNEGRIEYIAATPDMVASEMDKLFSDINLLLNSIISFEESFFYASLLHLVFVKIHPFEDGNGRTARLLEKWFLAEKLGKNAWYLQSEKMYYDNHQLYYNSIRQLGLEYNELDYSKALPFLQMLPLALTK